MDSIVDTEAKEPIVLDVFEITGGESGLYGPEQAEVLKKAIQAKRAEVGEDEDIILEFGRIKSVNNEFGKNFVDGLADDKKIRFQNLPTETLETSTGTAEQLIGESKKEKSERKPKLDKQFLNEVSSADKLSYVQSKVIAQLHPELLDDENIAQKFDWKECSGLVARFCPEKIEKNKDRFNWWKASDDVKASAPNLLEANSELRQMFIPGMERDVRFHDELHIEQVQLLAKEGARFGLSSTLVDKFKMLLKNQETLTGEQAIEMIAKDMFVPGDFTHSKFLVDNDTMLALKTMKNIGLNVDESTIDRVRLNEKQYLKFPCLDMSFGELKDQMGSLMKGGKTELMTVPGPDGQLVDCKYMLNYDLKSGALEMQQLVKDKKIKWPGFLTKAEREELLSGVEKINIKNGNLVQNYLAGVKIGEQLADLIRNQVAYFSLDKDLNKVIFSVKVPENVLDQARAEKNLLALDKHAEREELGLEDSVETKVVEKLDEGQVIQIENVAELEEAESELSVAVENLSIENKGEIEAPTEKHRENYQAEERNIAGVAVQKVENLKGFKRETKVKETKVVQKTTRKIKK